MDSGIATALAALAGSAIGSLGSFATTWVAQSARYRFAQIEKDKSRREEIYGSFIDESSKLFADAFHHEIEEATKLVTLYSIVSRMRLFASADILEHAENTMNELMKAFGAPKQPMTDLPTFDKMDPLRKFSDACRRELSSI